MGPTRQSDPRLLISPSGNPDKFDRPMCLTRRSPPERSSPIRYHFLLDLSQTMQGKNLADEHRRELKGLNVCSL